MSQVKTRANNIDPAVFEIMPVQPTSNYRLNVIQLSELTSYSVIELKVFAGEIGEIYEDVEPSVLLSHSMSIDVAL